MQRYDIILKAKRYITKNLVKHHLFNKNCGIRLKNQV